MRQLLAATALATVIASPAWAVSFTVANGVTDNTAYQVSGTDTGTVESGGTLSVTGQDAIRWQGPSTNVVITNDGTIVSTDERGIDTQNSNTPRTLTLDNNAGALLQGNGDAFRINVDTITSVTVNNAGTIFSETGQALDFDAVESGTVVINNNAGGVIRAAEADAVRPGEGATVTNFGVICVGDSDGTNCTGGVPNENHDGVDWQDKSGTLVNKTGGLISGARHGTTSDVDVNVTNEAGAAIIGRNGSGVGSDGDGTVVNFGTITGAIDGVSDEGDGDGVDIDFAADITNHGTIQGTGAKTSDPGDPNASEGIAAGGGIIRNMAGALISGADNGILIDDGSGTSAHSAIEIQNAGRIEGLNGYAIRFVGGFADVVRNAGDLAGITSAMELGGGDDLLELDTGSDIDGLSDGGDGFDTIEIVDGATVSLGNVVNFEKLIIGDGASLALESTVSIFELLGAIIDGDQVTNIAGGGFDYLYNPYRAGNAYLGGLTYQLVDGGLLRAVPAPATLALLLPAVALLAARRRR
jgi:hypothetical protein